RRADPARRAPRPPRRTRVAPQRRADRRALPLRGALGARRRDAQAAGVRERRQPERRHPGLERRDRPLDPEVLSDDRPGPFLVLTGPTAVGKTELSLRVAERLGAEIVSADSRQVYRELDVGTAKPGEAERARVPHRFVDELALGTPWSAGRFADAANERIAAILDRGGVPLVVGGSTLDLGALVHGPPNVAAADPAVRAALVREVPTPAGAAALFEELQRVDPTGAATLDPTKTQRLVRALEVYRTTGRPWSSYFEAVTPPPYRYRVVVLTRARAELYRRIEARVAWTLEAGPRGEHQRR